MILLQQLREARGLSPEQLGGLAGMAGNTVRRIETGSNTTMTTLGKLAEVLGVERAADLVEEVES